MTAASHPSGSMPGSGGWQGQAAQPQQQPPLYRVQWSLVVFTFGCVAMAVSLVLSLAGVPGRLGYDASGPGERNRPDSANPLAIMRSLDNNMKYIVGLTGHDPQELNWYFSNISASEDEIGKMATNLAPMNASVKEIDTELARVLATTRTMRADMDGLGAVSANSAATMARLSREIDGLSGSMSGLYAATARLTAVMAQIESNVGKVADRGTGRAVKRTRDLRKLLPEKVPTPVLTMQADPVAGGIGGGEGGVGGEAVAGVAPVPGPDDVMPLQPPAPPRGAR